MDMTRNILIFYLFLTRSVLYIHGYMEEMGQCEPIGIDMCSHLKYNMTRMPNFLGHTTQEEAIREFSTYSKFINLFNCSERMQFFLCSLFAPMCTQQLDGPLVIEVCRSMCLQVKSDCEPMLKELGMPWPLNCSRLPESNTRDRLCMEPETVKVLDPSPSPTQYSFRHPTTVGATPVTTLPESSDSDKKGSTCPPRFFKYNNSTCTDMCDPSCQDCVPRCDNVYFTESHKSLAYSWMAVWASLCLLATTITIIGVCIDGSRFRFPTRPVIYIAFCYLMYALAHIIRLFIPAENIACKSEGEEHLLIANGMESTLCILIFLIQYYFNMASHIWWLVLAVTWYLAASRKWGLEAINSIACYFHLFAWAVPAVLTIAILVTGKVDANDLTGMCYVGNQDKWAAVIYIIIPVCFLLLLGEVFLMAGFAALLRIRSNLKTQVNDWNFKKLEKLMAKIGIFAILYTIPTVCMLVSYVYESMNIDAWRCMASTLPLTDDLLTSVPTVEIHMLKIFTSFIIGITTCMWVLNSKTFRTCRNRCKSKSHSSPPLRNFTRPQYMVGKPVDVYSSSGFSHQYNFPSNRNAYLSSHYSHSNIGNTSEGVSL